MSWPSMTRGLGPGGSQRPGPECCWRHPDAGAHWAPDDAVDGNGATQVLFADTSNGWIAGAKELWSTHDGGATWAPVTVVGGLATAAALAAAGRQGARRLPGRRDRTNLGVHIASSPIDHDDFVPTSVTIPVGAGPRLEVSMSAGGPYGEMIYDDRTFIGAAQIVDGRWAPWDVTCPYENPSATAGLSPDGQELAIACSPSGFGDDAAIVGANLSTGTLTWTTVEPADEQADGRASARFATSNRPWRARHRRHRRRRPGTDRRLDRRRRRPGQPEPHSLPAHSRLRSPTSPTAA